MKLKYQRLSLIIIGILCLGSSVALILNNFNDNLVFFYSPSDLAKKEISSDTQIRIGGLIEKGTVNKKNGNFVEFNITDLNESILVRYEGILPPMFREEQGMVARGHLQKNGVFLANNLLTKHDENYMPPEVAKALNEQSHHNLRENSKEIQEYTK